jgi:hemerythrin-like domain-containing protein
MKITDRLNVEHGIFLKLLDRLDGLLAEGASIPVLTGATDMLLSAMEPHCQFEDRTLYPMLRDALGSHCPPLVAEAAAHRDIECLASLVAADGCEREDIAALARALREHIEKEIHMILPLATEWIPEPTLARMCDWHGQHIREHAQRRAERASHA